MKPRIGITTFQMVNPTSGLPRNALNAAYSDAVIKSGGLPFLIPNMTDEILLNETIEAMDGFVLSGGDDINPLFYNEEPHPQLGETFMFVDKCHLEITKKAIEAKKPILAICRGHQALNIVCGGTLYQDIPSQCKVMKHYQTGSYSDICHKVTIKKGSKLHEYYGDEVMASSFHHQSIKDLGKGLVAVGHTSDGIIEAVEFEDYPFCVSVQWHPEAMLVAENSMKILFDEFIKACN